MYSMDNDSKIYIVNITNYSWSSQKYRIIWIFFHWIFSSIKCTISPIIIGLPTNHPIIFGFSIRIFGLTITIGFHFSFDIDWREYKYRTFNTLSPDVYHKKQKKNHKSKKQKEYIYWKKRKGQPNNTEKTKKNLSANNAKNKSSICIISKICCIIILITLVGLYWHL